MKKLLILVVCTTLLVFGTKAFADVEICGDFYVLEITLYDSSRFWDVPIAPCELWIEFFPHSGQGPYILPATAFGTQLNLALLKAYNFDETVDACLLLTIIPPDRFVVEVNNATFGGL
jgi:hypothetical protein